MKKQDKHPIDTFFKENTEQHFPYDPALWSKADKGIAALFGRKYRFIFFAVFFVFISSIAVFFSFDNHAKTGKISMFKKSGSPVLTKNSSSVKSKGNSIRDGENALYSSTKNETIDANASENPDETIISGKPNTPIDKEEDNQESKEGKIIPSKQNDLITKEEIIKKEEVPLNSEAAPIAILESPTIETKEVAQKIEYINFEMFSIPFEAFSFGISQSPEKNYVNLDPKKRRFATTIEFENLNSIFLTHQLAGLPKNELDYRNKNEKVKNASAYSLNIMFQRGGFGLVTGLGYSDAAIKTNYIITSKTFDLSEPKFRLLDTTVRYSNGTFWSNIKEFRDTIARHSEEGPLKGQASKNVFQWIQVPLKISYQYPLYRFRFSARVGADFMWLINAKGTFINSSLDALNNEEKLKQFNINASGQFMAGYQLNHKIQVGGSIYINKQLGSNFINYNSRFGSKGFGCYVRWSL